MATVSSITDLLIRNSLMQRNNNATGEYIVHPTILLYYTVIIKSSRKATIRKMNSINY